MQVRHGIPEDELAARRERLLEHVRREGLTGYVLFDARLHPVLHGLRLPLDGAPGRLRPERGRRHGRVRPGVRGRAGARRDGLRADRVVSRVPGDRAPDADPRARARRPRHRGLDRRRPGRLPGDPRLPGPCAQRGDGEHGHAALGRDRADDGAKERERDRADPRERALVRARPPAAAGVHEARRDRGRGEPQGGTRGDARDAEGARRPVRRAAGLVRRRVGRLPRPDRPAQLVGARGRPQHRVPGRATCSSPRRARRSGATTPSSSAP